MATNAKERMLQKRREKMRVGRKNSREIKRRTILYPTGESREFSNLPKSGRVTGSKEKVIHLPGGGVIAAGRLAAGPKATTVNPPTTRYTKVSPLTTMSFDKAIANKAKGSKPVAKTNIKVAPVRPAESAGATSHVQEGKSSDAALSEQSKSLVHGAIGAAAGATATAVANKLRERVRQRVAGRIISAAEGVIKKPNAASIEAAETAAKSSAPQKDPGGAKNAMRRPRLRKRSAGEHGATIKESPPPENTIAVKNPKGTTAKQEGTKAPAVKTPQPKQSTPRIKAGVGANTDIKDAETAIKKAGTSRDALLAEKERLLNERKALLAKKQGTKQSSTPTATTGPKQPRVKAPQPDVSSPARAQESPTQGGIDSSVANRKALEAERDRLKAEIVARKGGKKPRIKAKGGTATSQSTEKAGKPKGGTKTPGLRSSASAGSKSPRAILRKGTGRAKQPAPDTSTPGRNVESTPLPIRVKPAPTEASLPQERIAAERAAARREAAKDVNRPGPGTLKPRLPKEVQGRADQAELSRLRRTQESAGIKGESEVSVKDIRKARLRQARQAQKAQSTVGSSYALSKQPSEITTRKAQIEKFIKEKGVTKGPSPAEIAKAIEEGKAIPAGIRLSKTAARRALRVASKAGKVGTGVLAGAAVLGAATRASAEAPSEKRAQAFKKAAVSGAKAAATTAAILRAGATAGGVAATAARVGSRAAIPVALAATAYDTGRAVWEGYKAFSAWRDAKANEAVMKKKYGNTGAATRTRRARARAQG